METTRLAVLVVQQVRALLVDAGFQFRHRRSVKAFTRKRKLSFDVVMLLVLQKTLKSIQLHLHDFFRMLNGAAQSAVTAGDIIVNDRGYLCP